MASEQSIFESKFDRHELNSASEVLTALRLSNPAWFPTTRVPDNEWVRRWYFRGQRDMDMPLLPGAWRMTLNQPIELGKQEHAPVRSMISAAIRSLFPNGLPYFLDQKDMDRVGAAAMQIVVELQIVREFIDLADSIGHRTPTTEIPLITDNLCVRVVKELIGPAIGPRPNPLLKRIWFDPAIALAQHHGIQTRLLDFTQNPLAAAYFAASDVIDKPPESKHFAIYAIHSYHIPNKDFPLSDNEGRVRRLQVNRSENEFLRAQEGVFVVDTEADQHYIKTGHYPHLMESLFDKGEQPIDYKPIQFVIPISVAPELLRQLFLERITKAHLMPTLDNAAQTIINKWRSVLTLPKRES